MGTRKFNRRWSEPSHDHLTPSAWVSAASDQKLFNAAVHNYAFARRNIAAGVFNTDNAGSLSLSGTDGSWNHFCTIPIYDRVVAPGSVTFNFLYSTANETAGYEVYARCSIGTAQTVVQLSNASETWTSTTLTIDEDDVNAMIGGGMLNIEFRVFDGGNTLDLRCICAYQKADASAPTWVDIGTTGCTIGTDYWPNSARTYELLTDSINAVRQNRVMRSNVFTKYFGTILKTGNSYGVDNDDLGNYRFIKRAGVEKVLVHCCCHSDDASNAFTGRLEITGTTNAVAADTFDYTAQSDPMWDSVEFTFTGVDITNEVECGLLVDAKDNSHSMNIYICGVCITEEHLASSSITHIVPDVPDVRAGTVVEAQQWDDVRDTMVHLWERGGVNIAMQDWRPGSYLFYPEATSRDKTDYGPGGVGNPDTSVVARAICFPSTNASRIRLAMGFHTTSGSSYTKKIEMQLSDSMTDGTYDERGPNGDNPLHFDSDYSETVVTVGCLLEVTAADEETPASALDHTTDTPYQAWIFAWTENSTEYILPDWITIEEVALAYSEFP